MGAVPLEITFSFVFCDDQRLALGLLIFLLDNGVENVVFGLDLAGTESFVDDLTPLLDAHGVIWDPPRYLNRQGLEAPPYLIQVTSSDRRVELVDFSLRVMCEEISLEQLQAIFKEILRLYGEWLLESCCVFVEHDVEEAADVWDSLSVTRAHLGSISLRQALIVILYHSPYELVTRILEDLDLEVEPIPQ